jgi:hypothetical protein
MDQLNTIASNPQQYALAGKAHCLSMCDPLTGDRQSSNFEFDQRKQQIELLAVTRFRRSDAGKNMSDPEILRPPIILFWTMVYLRDCIVDQDLTPPG